MPDVASAPTEIQTPSPLTVEGIFRDYAPFAWRALRRLGVAERDVDDACQEVFVVVHRKLQAFEGRSTVRTWVYGICVRVAADYRKRGHVRREQVTGELPENAATDDPHADAARRQARQTLDRILDELDYDKRTVFVLFEIEQITMAEVAEAVGCPLQTAYSRLHAARKIVTERIAHEQSSGGAS